MGKTLIIVESPTKIKTLKKFLGKEFVLESSVGHIRDLPKKGFGIDLDNNFEPVYETLPVGVVLRLGFKPTQSPLLRLFPLDLQSSALSVTALRSSCSPLFAFSALNQVTSRPYRAPVTK